MLKKWPGETNSIWIDNSPSDVPCAVCSGVVYEFSIPNDLWNRVVRAGGPETDKEYLCMGCFLNVLRRELGLVYVEAEMLRLDLMCPYCHTDSDIVLNEQDGYSQVVCENCWAAGPREFFDIYLDSESAEATEARVRAIQVCIDTGWMPLLESPTPSVPDEESLERKVT